jgi:hypothetical protein
VVVDVVYASGEHVSSGYAWNAANQPVQAPGDPPTLTVVPTCVRLDVADCRSMAESALGGRPVPPPVRAIVVTCTAVCGPDVGRGTTLVTYVDGTTEHGDWTYSG